VRFSSGKKAAFSPVTKHGREHHPDEELGQAHQSHADDLSHHQLKGFYRTYNHLDDAAHLFLDHPAHHLGSEKENEKEDQHAAQVSQAHDHAGIAFLCLPRLWST
jgi:hypothetical protein